MNPNDCGVIMLRNMQLIYENSWLLKAEKLNIQPRKGTLWGYVNTEDGLELKTILLKEIWTGRLLFEINA